MSSRNVLQAIGLILATPMLALAQTEAVDPGATGPAWSPYLVGVLIGVLLLELYWRQFASSRIRRPEKLW